MIVYENLGNGIIRAYSNTGVKIHGGMPEGNYDIVYDPEDANRKYTETNIPTDEPSPPTPKSTDLSRVKLYRKFKAMGIWDQVKAWMQSQDGVWEEWEYSTTLEKENQLVKSAIVVLKSEFGLSDEVVDNILAECVVD